MIVEETENGSLNFDSENFDILKNGIVIFPENLKDVKKIEKLKKFLESISD